MRLLDIETDYESERDLRRMQKQFLTHTHTYVHTLSLYCFVSIDYGHVGSIMHGAGAVKERTVLWLWAVRQREYTSMDVRTQTHNHDTLVLFYSTPISQSLSHPTQRLTQTVTNAS